MQRTRRPLHVAAHPTSRLTCISSEGLSQDRARGYNTAWEQPSCGAPGSLGHYSRWDTTPLTNASEAQQLRAHCHRSCCPHAIGSPRPCIAPHRCMQRFPPLACPGIDPGRSLGRSGLRRRGLCLLLLRLRMREGATAPVRPEPSSSPPRLPAPILALLSTHATSASPALIFESSRSKAS